MSDKSTIFVQIASYRDPECQWTIKDLFEKAEHPERVFVGVCWQYNRKEDHACFQVLSPNPVNTMTLMVDAARSRGVCWARWQAQKLYGAEDYVLMIDSHMRFIKNWDTELIAELERCNSDKPLLSTYPPGYTPPDNLTPDPKPTYMHAKPFDEKGDVRFKANTLKKVPHKPLRGAFLAAGFVFGKADFLREVPYDPYLYFANEEACLAARAYTHGWDVFSPTRHFTYHYYHVPAKGHKKVLHWDDNKDWIRLTMLSRERTNYMLAGEQPENPEALAELDQYGLGTVRSLADFEKFSGLDFKNRTATERALKGEFVEGLIDFDPVKAA